MRASSLVWQKTFESEGEWKQQFGVADGNDVKARWVNGRPLGQAGISVLQGEGAVQITWADTYHGWVGAGAQRRRRIFFGYFLV